MVERGESPFGPGGPSQSRLIQSGCVSESTSPKHDCWAQPLICVSLRSSAGTCWPCQSILATFSTGVIHLRGEGKEMVPETPPLYTWVKLKVWWENSRVRVPSGAERRCTGAGVEWS